MYFFTVDLHKLEKQILMKFKKDKNPILTVGLFNIIEFYAFKNIK